ncbi:MAG: hypothetical protein Q8K70_12180 [Bacteroidota bacterium]|nr:hypothetical protein [Bacteroidota bacterium]
MIKNIKLLIGIVSMAMATACNNSGTENQTETMQEPTEMETEKTTTTTTTTQTNDDGTTIEIDQNGVSYGKKDGNNETTVKITNDTTNFKIKR